MSKLIGTEAEIRNPALVGLAGLVGQWTTSGSHPLLPDKALHGRTSFAWHDGGAFLVMRSEIDEPEIPSGIAYFGSDDQAEQIFMIYFDERGVSRKYDVTVDGSTVTWSREDPKLSQTMTVTVGTDRLQAKGRMSREGEPWEDDLSLTYERSE